MIDLKNKIFLDTDGEMTFENKERLNFIMHFMKKGATEQVATSKDGKFVREDAEMSFREIWLACAESKQAEIDLLKAKLVQAHKLLSKAIETEPLLALGEVSVIAHDLHVLCEGGDWVLVPKVPTEKMYLAGVEVRRNYGNTNDVYKAMIEAAQEENS